MSTIYMCKYNFYKKRKPPQFEEAFFLFHTPKKITPGSFLSFSVVRLNAKTASASAKEFSVRLFQHTLDVPSIFCMLLTKETYTGGTFDFLLISLTAIRLSLTKIVGEPLDISVPIAAPSCKAISSAVTTSSAN